MIAFLRRPRCSNSRGPLEHIKACKPWETLNVGYRTENPHENETVQQQMIGGMVERLHVLTHFYCLSPPLYYLNQLASPSFMIPEETCLIFAYMER